MVTFPFLPLSLSEAYAPSSAPAHHSKPAPVRRASYRWKNVDIVAGGFVDGIIYHPKERNLAYARTDIGGAYRWDVDSGRWIPLLDWLTKKDWNLYGIEALAIDPSDGRRLFLACGTYTNEWGGNGAILCSHDQGRTFSRTDLPFKLGGNEDGRSMGERMAVDPRAGDTLYFGTRNNGLWQSHDRGRHWDQVSGFPVLGRTNGIGVTSVAFDPRSSKSGSRCQSIYVGVASHDHNLFHSTDGGVTWSAVANSPQGFFVHHLLVTSTGKVYETLSDGPGPNGITGGAVYRMDPGNGVWTEISPVKPHQKGEGGFGYAGLVIDPRDENRVAVSTLDRWNPGDDVFVSRDGGDHWSGLRATAVMDAKAAPYMTWGAPAPRFGWWTGSVAMDPNRPGRILFGTGANIWGCDDVSPATRGRQTHWTVRGTGIEETADIDLLSPPAGPPLITALGDIGGFTHPLLDHPPIGMSLNPLLNNTDSLACSKDGSTIAKVGRPGNGQLAGGLSHDNGITWKPFLTLPARGAVSGQVSVSADGKTILWATGNRGIYLTQDEGKTWRSSAIKEAKVDIIADPIDPKHFYALAADGTMLASSDRGLHFEIVSKVAARQDGGKLVACFGRSGDLWLPAGDGLYHSVTGGQLFRKMPGVDSAESVGLGKAPPGHPYPSLYLNGKVEGVEGVFRSDDLGKSWIMATDKSHEYGTRGVIIGDPRLFGRFYMGTNGRGVLYADPN